ncbi:MAG: hypothetical protein ACK6D3_05160 [Planctomycetaceae bacterium]
MATGETVSALAEKFGFQPRQIPLRADLLLARADKAQARRRITAFAPHDNAVRLHSAIGDITPPDTLQGLEHIIFQERDRKLEEARKQRQVARQQAGPHTDVAG